VVGLPIGLLCEMVGGAVPAGGGFVFLVVESDGAGAGRVAMASNAPEGARVVMRRFVDAGGRSAVPAVPPPPDRAAWLRDELPKLLDTVAMMRPDVRFTIFLWSGDPDGLAGVVVAGNLPREAAVEVVAAGLEGEAAGRAGSAGGFARRAGGVGGLVTAGGNEAGAWRGALS
jgi:hypothetical protein